MAFASVIGMWRIHRLSAALQWTTLFVSITLVEQTIAIVLPYHGYTNFPIFHVYAIVTVVLYYFIYKNIIGNLSSWKVVRFLFLVLFILSIANTLFIQGIFAFPSLSINAQSIVMLICCFIFYTEIFLNKSDTRLWTRSLFWLNSGFFVYHLTTFLVWAIMNYLIQNNIDVKTVVWLTIPFNIVFYLSLGVALLLEDQKHEWK